MPPVNKAVYLCVSCIFFHFFYDNKMEVFSHINLAANLHLLCINPSCYDVVWAISAMNSCAVAFSKKSFAILGWTCPTFALLRDHSSREVKKNKPLSHVLADVYCFFQVEEPLELHTSVVTQVFCTWKKATGLEQDLRGIISYLFPTFTQN